MGVIGTGANQAQLITEIAKDIGKLTVFQLKPEYCVPLGNRPIDENTQRDIKKIMLVILKSAKIPGVPSFMVLMKGLL